MIIINIDPNIATIGPFTFSWHGLLTAIGLLAGVWLAAKLAPRVGLTDEQVLNAAVWAVPAGIVGARLVHVVDNLSYYLENPGQIIAIYEGGIAVWGAILGGIAGIVIYALITKDPLGPLADVGSAGLVLGQAIGRVGDVINGEHHASATSLPWGVEYTHPATLGQPGIAVHPAVLYELIWDLILLGVVLRLLGRLPRPGMALLIYAFLYGFGRFFLGFTRLDPAVVLGLSQAQVISILVMAGALVVFAFLSREQIKSGPLREAEE